MHLTAACISASGMSGLHFSQPGEAGGAVEPALTPRLKFAVNQGLAASVRTAVFTLRFSFHFVIHD